MSMNAYSGSLIIVNLRKADNVFNDIGLFDLFQALNNKLI